MTEIDFYTHVEDAVAVAAKLCIKAYRLGMRARVLTADARQTERLDRMLWLEPALGFIPHCRLRHRLAAETPVWIDESNTHEGPAELLINLGAEPPEFFARFHRLAEIVAGDEDSIRLGRQRYRFYRDRGYEVRTHKLGG